MSRLPQAEHVRIAGEEPSPRLRAENRDRRARVDRTERAAEAHPRRQRLEVIAGDEVRRQRAAVGSDEARVLGDDGVEQIAAVAQRLVVAPAEQRPAIVVRAPADAVERSRIAHGEGAQHVGVEDGEDDGQQAEADGERQHGRHEKGRTLSQPAPAVAEILDDVLEPHPAAGFIEALGRRGDVAEGAHRRGARGGGAHAVGDEAGDLEIEVGLYFGGEIFLRASGRHPT